MARGGQRCHFVCCCLCSVVYVRCCFSRNASFKRTAFCEYTLYFFWSFFCDFLLLLLLLSPFFGIVSLGGSERRKWPAECTLEPRFWRCPRRVRLRFIGTWSCSILGVWSGLENVLRMSPTRSLLHLLGRGAGPVIRRVWTLTCDRETRRPRPRRDGAKLTGSWAPHR